MVAGFWSSNALSLSFASSTFSTMPAEVRAIALAVVNAMSNLAQIYGAYLFPTTDAPKSLKGFGLISGMLGVGVITYTILQVVLSRRGKRGFE
jgi:hypothetical protein